MSDVENSSKNQNVEIDESAKKPLNRRQFLIKGATYSVPVVMTVAASPVLANHCSVSGTLSGNLSRPGTDDHICVGLTPGYWGQHPKEWNSLGFYAGDCQYGDMRGSHCKYNAYKDDGTPFDSSILGGKFDDGRFGTDTMMQVIQKGGNDDMYQLGAHACAALLNATKFESDPYTDFGYTPGQIIDMYNSRYRFDPEQLKLDFQLLNERSFGE